MLFGAVFPWGNDGGDVFREVVCHVEAYVEWDYELPGLVEPENMATFTNADILTDKLQYLYQ